jgi:SAM-dependent methyltransferase
VRPLLGPLRDLRTLARFVRERGVGHTGRVCALAVRGRWMAAADRRREARFGVSSEGSIALRGLAIDSENRTLGFSYVPSPGQLVDTLLFNIGEDLGRFSFVDFGSGKGRVLLVASHYPFREVVGVEFSPALHEIAEDNIRKYQSPARRCQNVRSVCADAATFPLPEHNCVLYFNNPFAEPVFARVLGNVQAAHERSHRKLYVLYQQLAGELETDRTHNIAMLERSMFLRERQVRFPSRRSRYLLGSYELRMFESVDPPSA